MKKHFKISLLTIAFIATLAAVTFINSPQVLAASDYTMTVSYAIKGDGKPTPPTLNYIDPSNQPQKYTLTDTPTPLQIKKGTDWSVKPGNTLIGSAVEQWYSSDKVWSGTAPRNGGSDTYVWTYLHQLKVTFDASSQVKSDSSDAFLTVEGSDLTGAQLPYTTGWISSGDSLTYSFKSPVASSSAPLTTRYLWDVAAAREQNPQSNTFTVTKAETITGQYSPSFYLTVTSPYGKTSGEGWYTQMETAYAVLDKGEIDLGNGTKHVFVQWSKDALGKDLTSEAITMDKPKTAFAEWKTEYQVSFAANPESYGSVTPSVTGWYAAGKTVTITATPYKGYSFASWSAAGKITIASPASSVTTATINGPGTITAIFQSSTPLLTALTISLDPPTAEASQVVNVIGHLTSKDTGVAGKQITLSYFDGLSWNPIGTATTASDGAYLYGWMVPAELANGQYALKAEFAGDGSYKASSATTGTLGNGGNLFVVPEYFLGGLVALVACFAALAIFKGRGKLQHNTL
ncbi:MAG: hypothetical protein NWF05_02860 [Candidatus Bathyarchaeota archaeon]|nr:hypothetical protein [Candidatus Bathyarchaeota archaeon]